MREQTKRRLIGGLVLVALALIVPLALINFSQGPREAMEVDSDVRVYEIEVPDEQSPDQETAPDSGEDADGINDEAIADVFPAESDPQPEEQAAAEPEQPTAEPETAAETKPESAAAPAAEPKTENRPGPKPKPAAAPSGSSYVVQVGSFGQRANAEKMQAKLAETKFNAFITEGEVDGATLYRVRVGPYPTNGEAAAAAEQLRGDGYKTQVFKQ